MNPETNRIPWWSYLPNFPKPAIVALMILADLVIPGAWFYNYHWGIHHDALQNGDLNWTNAIINPNPMDSYAAILALFQLNFEVLYMIFTKRRNLHE